MGVERERERGNSRQKGKNKKERKTKGIEGFIENIKKKNILNILKNYPKIVI